MANPSQYYDLLRRPLVTEKSSGMQGRHNKFSFEVASSANKVEVKKAVETLFKVKVLQVNMVTMPSKQRRTFGRVGSTSAWKKAVVTLRQGDSIDVI
ncbi:MAG: 50S ribosomal protein L23 [Planctomycetes bacterium]|nr:50S ribosomal protein L23 [Planctomycetota bacterium]